MTSSSTLPSMLFTRTKPELKQHDQQPPQEHQQSSSKKPAMIVTSPAIKSYVLIFAHLYTTFDSKSSTIFIVPLFVYILKPILEKKRRPMAFLHTIKDQRKVPGSLSPDIVRHLKPYVSERTVSKILDSVAP